MGVLTARAPRGAAAPRGGLATRVQAYLFVSPAVLLVAVLLYLPFLWTAFLSFTEYTGLGAAEPVGLDNYRDLLEDPVLATAVRNTLLWVAGTMLLPVGGGLAVAVLTYNLRNGTWYRLPFLLPYAMSSVAVAMMWGFTLQPGGAANVALGFLHLPGADTSFMSFAPTNTFAMIIAQTWQSLGVNMLLFVIGLQSIPGAVIEAARLDGAGGWVLFRRMLWPLMRPLTTVVIGLALVASLKTFELVWVMTGGGPGQSSETLAVTMYRATFIANKWGYGAAVAVLLTLVTGLGSLLYVRQQLRTR